MDRRSFIKDSALLLAASGSAGTLRAFDGLGNHLSSNERLITSSPMLQNYAETSIGVSFSVGSLANGYVLVGENRDLSDARKFKTGGYRLTEISDKVSQIRITGLKPSTKYYYKIGADRIHFGENYDMSIIGNEEDPLIYSFTTAGERSGSHFCVINDTHVRWDAIGGIFEKVSLINPSCVVWNGDASNVEETVDSLISIFLDPEVSRKDYASETPFLFCPGNHDYRGMANRHLERVWMFRQPEERTPEEWDLGRNFAVRTGDVAMIGLDTAEDRVDSNPRLAGLFNSEEYRKAQADWLARVLDREDIAGAPFIVAFCHIPLYDPDPSSNPGDIHPDDTDPRYPTKFGMWMRSCRDLWGPLLDKAGCQLVVTAHQHRYRFDPPSEGRGWAQIVGGGPDLNQDNYPTVMEGNVLNGRLEIIVHNIFTGQVQAVHRFGPRQH